MPPSRARLNSLRILFPVLLLSLALVGCAPASRMAPPASCPAPRPSSVTPGLMLVTLDSATSSGTFFALGGDGKLTMLNTAEGTSMSGNLDADWSPAAGQAVLVQGSRQQAELYLAGTDGSRRRLTENGWEDTTPVWSPDGRSVAFVAWQDGAYKPYIICGDGSGLRPASNNPALTARELSWSPDGSRLVLQTELSDRGGENELVVIEAATGNEAARLRNNAANLLPRWSPDGRVIAFISTAEGAAFRLFLWNPEGGEQRPIGAGGDISEFGWAPAGGALAYTAGIGSVVGTLNVRSIDGSIEHIVQDSRELERSLMRRAAWSPDGCLAYATFRGTGENEVFRLVVTPIGAPNWLPETPVLAREQEPAAVPVAWIYAADAPTPCAVFR